MPSNTSRIRAALAIAVAAGACACDLGDDGGLDADDLCVVLCGDDGGDSIDPPPRSLEGEKRGGWFHYLCTTQTSDAICISTTVSEEWPAGIAVGGRFAVEYLSDGGGTPPVMPASAELVSSSGAELVVEADGLVALLAGDAVAIVDSVHARGVEVASLAVRRHGESPALAITLYVGDEVDLVVSPLDAAGGLLAGSLDYAWSSSREDVVVVEPDGAVGAAVALVAGEAVITVSGAGRSVDVAVTVEDVGP